MSNQGSCCGGGRHDHSTIKQRENTRLPSSDTEKLRGPADTCGCEEARGAPPTTAPTAEQSSPAGSGSCCGHGSR